MHWSERVKPTVGMSRVNKRDRHFALSNTSQHAFDLHSHAGRLCLHRDRIGSEGLRGEAAEQPACPRDRLAPPRFRRGEVSGASLGVSELHTGLMLLPFGFVLN